MNIDPDWLTLASFVVATTFSPGPNNISSASMGILYGYRKTLGYLIGIASGFFLVMVACAFLSSTLLTVLPASQIWLRWLGSAYILWLAWGVFRSGSSLKGSEPKNSAQEKNPRAFIKGFLLQLVNPKVMVYGLTLFSSFLASVAGQMGRLLFYAFLFASVAFTATSTWAFFGAVIKNRLKNDRFRMGVNGCLVVLLIYTAVDLSGVLSL